MNIHPLPSLRVERGEVQQELKRDKTYFGDQGMKGWTGFQLETGSRVKKVSQPCLRLLPRVLFVSSRDSGCMGMKDRLEQR